jgi:hypothetical protein
MSPPTRRERLFQEGRIVLLFKRTKRALLGVLEKLLNPLTFLEQRSVVDLMVQRLNSVHPPHNVVLHQLKRRLLFSGYYQWMDVVCSLASHPYDKWPLFCSVNTRKTRLLARIGVRSLSADMTRLSQSTTASLTINELSARIQLLSEVGSSAYGLRLLSTASLMMTFTTSMRLAFRWVSLRQRR